MRFHVDNYNKSNDADLFIENLLLSRERPSSILGKLRYLLVGDRSHMWMYDGNSLCSLLLSEGFKDVLVLKPGELNFQERMPESVLVEAVNP